MQSEASPERKCLGRIVGFSRQPASGMFAQYRSRSRMDKRRRIDARLRVRQAVLIGENLVGAHIGVYAGFGTDLMGGRPIIAGSDEMEFRVELVGLFRQGRQTWPVLQFCQRFCRLSIFFPTFRHGEPGLFEPVRPIDQEASFADQGNPVGRPAPTGQQVRLHREKAVPMIKRNGSSRDKIAGGNGWIFP